MAALVAAIKQATTLRATRISDATRPRREVRGLPVDRASEGGFYCAVLQQCGLNTTEPREHKRRCPCRGLVGPGGTISRHANCHGDLVLGTEWTH